jgi:ferredoxin
MIKVEVDMTQCQHYGHCLFEAPEIFRFNQDDNLEYTAEADDSELENIKSAIDVCPMQAIRIVE